ncbi:DUF3667 domain-containing protein [Bacteroides sp. 214]|uniref:DUF3667 domain-containing protein n=1 Tax=Bacteroides sp. 214 TaxID=2302935 RepID=UPI0013D2BA09|nr:DUF3667 domain-containing protein [Bacteroides sp. 214]
MHKKADQHTTTTKKNKTLPVHCICRNCETVVISRYCHNCGQDIFAGRERTIREITGNTLETIFALDNKILRTLKYLLFFPGRLTNEFFVGKVVKYVYPAKLFWFTTLIFFTILALTVEINDENESELTVEVGEAQITPKTDTNAKNSIAVLNKESQQNKETVDRFFSYIPYCMLFLVPIFAFLLFTFFYKNKKYYAHHLIFSMHFHAFTFIYLALVLIILELSNIEEANFWVYAGAPTIYFLVALYIVYRPKKRNMLWKVPTIMLLYAIFAAISTLVLVVISYIITTGGIEIFEELFSD